MTRELRPTYDLPDPQRDHASNQYSERIKTHVRKLAAPAAHENLVDLIQNAIRGAGRPCYEQSLPAGQAVTAIPTIALAM